MQARTKKLQPVIRHVDKNEQEAMQAVAYSQKQLQLQQEILEKLHDYKQEYIDKQGQPGQVSFNVLQLQEFNRFLLQLDETIHKQQQVVDLAAREVEIKRQKWQGHRSRSQAMHKVVDRMAALEQQQEQLTEQKFMDEIATRNSLKNA